MNDLLFALVLFGTNVCAGVSMRVWLMIMLVSLCVESILVGIKRWQEFLYGY